MEGEIILAIVNHRLPYGRTKLDGLSLFNIAPHNCPATDRLAQHKEPARPQAPRHAPCSTGLHLLHAGRWDLSPTARLVL